MSAGYRGLFAFWVGGAAGVAPTTSGGVRSMLAPWIGGANSAPAAGATGGCRSMLAFWAGGACGGIGGEPPLPPPYWQTYGGGHGPFETTHHRPRTREPLDDDDDDDLLVIVTHLMRVLQ